MDNDILYEKDGRLRVITINRPGKMNSLDFSAHETLVQIWHEFNADTDARVALITGTGDQAFCAGADLKTYTMALPRPLPRNSTVSTLTGPDWQELPVTSRCLNP